MPRAPFAGEGISCPRDMRSPTAAKPLLDPAPARLALRPRARLHFFATDITEVWQAEQRLEAANAALVAAESSRA